MDHFQIIIFSANNNNIIKVSDLVSTFENIQTQREPQETLCLF